MKEPGENFICLRCGNCCTIKGPVRLTAGEADEIAAVLNLPVEDFINRYTELSGDRLALILKDSYDGCCIFLQPDRLCRIEDAKPKQCRGFPVNWKYDGWTKVCSSNYAGADTL